MSSRRPHFDTGDETNVCPLPSYIITHVIRVYIEYHWSTGGKKGNSIGGKFLKTLQRNLSVMYILRDQEFSRKGKRGSGRECFHNTGNYQNLSFIKVVLCCQYILPSAYVFTITENKNKKPILKCTGQAILIYLYIDLL